MTLKLARELYRRNPSLALFGWILIGLFAITLVGSLFDSRTILGINPWIKPMKFMLSITIYVWTVAWLLEYVSSARFFVKFITGGTLVAMMGEIILIAMQSARGVTSHFNNSTMFDGIVFGVMGLMIAFSTLLEIILLVLFFRKDITLPRPYLWGIRLGILIFLLGSMVGGELVGHNSHTVGAPDGGPGLPFVNWSTIAGDLRISHALGLHGLQALPVIGFVISKSRLPDRGQSAAVLLAGIAYAALVGVLYLEARQGIPLIAR